MMLVRFTGAAVTQRDDGTREYTPREDIYINPELVAGVYSHTIMIPGNKIRVMEDLTEIRRRLREVSAID